MIEYENKYHKIGIITLIFGIVFNFAPALYLWFAHGVHPPVGDLFTIQLAAAAAYGAAWIVQPLSFYPLLGNTQYIAFLAGAVADIRTPALTMAQKMTKCENGTPEGDVMATLGITTSIFVSHFIVTFFAVVGVGILNALPQAVQASFAYILPAIFSAIYIEMAFKAPKLGVFTIVVAAIYYHITVNLMKMPAWSANLIIVVLGILCARVLFIMEKKANVSA